MKNNKIQKMILAVVLCSAMSFVKVRAEWLDKLKDAAPSGLTAVGGVFIALYSYDALMGMRNSSAEKNSSCEQLSDSDSAEKDYSTFDQVMNYAKHYGKKGASFAGYHVKYMAAIGGVTLGSITAIGQGIGSVFSMLK